ncbi:MAG: LPS export ABC transporter ATP-binding protein [Gammaproteobacteria bacterium]|nr:MAG: LPS export ABC transporter ATP-binding protein [Gammaproteobacteria bacterium]
MATATMKNKTLSAKNLGKSYGKREILKDVNFHIKNNEVVGLLGPNGAGKTTSFYMIVGLIKQDKGEILLDGEDISHMVMHNRARLGIGYLPQEASVFRKLTVEQNIKSILEINKKVDKKNYQQRTNLLLDEFQIAHIKESIGSALSGGERRRVEIARALAADPDFILLDEPFAGVDPLSVIEIQKIIKQLVQRNIGVLITDHNVRETLGVCDRAYILSDGVIIADGSSADILKNKKVKKVYLGENFNL